VFHIALNSEFRKGITKIVSKSTEWVAFNVALYKLFVVGCLSLNLDEFDLLEIIVDHC